MIEFLAVEAATGIEGGDRALVPAADPGIVEAGAVEAEVDWAGIEEAEGTAEVSQEPI